MGWLLLTLLAGAEPVVYTVRDPDDAEGMYTARRDVEFWVDLPDPVCDAVDDLSPSWGACLADGDILPIEIIVGTDGAIQQVTVSARQACLAAALVGAAVEAAGTAGRCELFVTGAQGAVAKPLYERR